MVPFSLFTKCRLCPIPTAESKNYPTFPAHARHEIRTAEPRIFNTLAATIHLTQIYWERRRETVPATLALFTKYMQPGVKSFVDLLEPLIGASRHLSP